MNQVSESRVDRSDPRSIGKRAWLAIHEHGIPPTPQSFEVFYALFEGSNQALAERIRYCEASGQLLTLEYINALHRECIINTSDSVAVAAGAEDLAETARSIVDHIAQGGEAIRKYGNSLNLWGSRLNPGSSEKDLLHAFAELSAETERASVRNRALEAQLSLSASRIARLREDLLQVRQEAATDALTGIANRRAFDTKLGRAVREYAGDPSAIFTILMVDVDHFKRFNDLHGHKTGDHVLRRVARLLADNVKGRDTVARFGGEEFVVLLVGAGLAAGLTVANQLRERLSSLVLVKRGTGESIGQVTISIGVAEHRSGEKGSELLERADGALYEAKRSGRNRVCTSAISANLE